MTGPPTVFGCLIKSLSTALIWQLKWDQIKANFSPQTSAIDVIFKLVDKAFNSDV